MVTAEKQNKDPLPRSLTVHKDFGKIKVHLLSWLFLRSCSLCIVRTSFKFLPFLRCVNAKSSEKLKATGADGRWQVPCSTVLYQ